MALSNPGELFTQPDLEILPEYALVYDGFTDRGVCTCRQATQQPPDVQGRNPYRIGSLRDDYRHAPPGDVNPAEALMDDNNTNPNEPRWLPTIDVCIHDLKYHFEIYHAIPPLRADALQNFKQWVQSQTNPPTKTKPNEPKMPAPSPLKIATDAVSRLTKEEKMYQKELTSQQERVKKLEADLKNGSASEDGNAEFMVKQEQKAIEETKAVFGPLQTRIGEAVSRLEEQIASAEGDSNANADELTKAKEVLASTPKDDA